MSEELMIPEFLEKQSFEDIMDEMINGRPEEGIPGLPADLDVSEGSHAYNLLAPTAVQMEYFAGYILSEAIKMIFPKYCEGYDGIVDYHAESTGRSRAEAVKATGTLRVTGPIGTEIPSGSIFSTYSTDNTPAIQFLSDEYVVIENVIEASELPTDDSKIVGMGEVQIKITAEEAGAAGNVKAGSIQMFDIDDIQIEQLEDMINGVDQQSTEDLINEIVQYEANQGISYVGCAADYKNWAEEVHGVGSATIISPEDGSGEVRIIITGADGNGANDDLCEMVRNYIMPDKLEDRRAPINAKVTVVSATPISLFIKVQTQLTRPDTEETREKELVISRFVEEVKKYLKSVMDGDKIIQYHKIAAILSETVGIYDFKNLEIREDKEDTNNTGIGNISIQDGKIPMIGDVEFVPWTE